MNNTSKDPWKSWTFNQQFFAELNTWNIQHPETTLDLVLANVCDTLDLTANIRSLIPDNPFPARTLVEGLCQLTKLGATVHSIKRDIYNFVKEIGKWVTREAVAYQQVHGGGNAKFTAKTWDNLTEIHDLIEEICKWAGERLNDGLSKRIRHSLFVGKEVSEFKTRINDAISRFMHLSVISIAEGQDAIIEKVRICIETIQGEGRMLLDIIDKFEHESRIKFIKTTIGSRLAHNTSYVDQSKGFCAPDTRLTILQNFNDWIQNLSDEAPCFAWLTGPPGAGKSSIVASLCRQLKDNHVLWAHYFINRNYISTLDPNSFFPTIAVQLSIHSPDIALLIYETLKEKPSLGDIISHEQAEALFIKPLTTAALYLHPFEPIVIAIDALDECTAKSLSKIATILSDAFTRLPNNVKVILSSRVESPIKSTFSNIPCQRLLPLWQIDLETSKDTSMQDVELVIRREIGAVASDFQLDPVKWPGEQHLKMLCEQASGLFIWAITAVSFIREKLTKSIRYRDRIVEQLLQNGMDDINNLYKTILDNMYPEGTDDVEIQDFRRVVGAIVVLSEPLSLCELARLLEDTVETSVTAHTDTASQSVKIDEIIIHIVRQFRTVLVAGTEDVGGSTVPHLHKSFYEFITAKKLDVRFRVNKFISNRELARKCLRRFQRLREISSPQSVHRETIKMNLKYLDASISCYDTFLALEEAASISSEEKSQHSHSLAVALSLRVKNPTVGIPHDLDRALEMCMKALALAPTDEMYPQRPVIQDLLCDICLRIFRSIPHNAETTWASRFEDAAQHIPETNCLYPHVTGALGWLLASSQDLGRVNQSVSLLQKAIELYDAHMNLQPLYCLCSILAISNTDGSGSSGTYFLTTTEFRRYLGSALCRRFLLSSDLDDVNRSVFAFEEALQSLPENSTKDRISVLLCLSQPLSLRIEANQSFEGPDFERTSSLFKELLQASPPASLIRRLETKGASFDSVSYDADLKSNIMLLQQEQYPIPLRDNYFQALASIRNDHPDKPIMVAGLYDLSNNAASWGSPYSPPFNPAPGGVTPWFPATSYNPMSPLSYTGYPQLSALPYNPAPGWGTPFNPPPLPGWGTPYAPGPGPVWSSPYYLAPAQPNLNNPPGWGTPFIPPLPAVPYSPFIPPPMLAGLPPYNTPWPRPAPPFPGPSPPWGNSQLWQVQKKISALKLAILLLRKFGYSQRRTSGYLWKYSQTAQYNNQHPEELEMRLSLRLIELMAETKHSLSPFEKELAWKEARIEIQGELDKELFNQIVCTKQSTIPTPWGTGALLLADLENVRCGPVIEAGNEPRISDEKEVASSPDPNNLESKAVPATKFQSVVTCGLPMAPTEPAPANAAEVQPDSEGTLQISIKRLYMNSTFPAVTPSILVAVFVALLSLFWLLK